VLHVIESYGSGSLTAAVQYVRSTPDLEHHLLRRIRDDYVPFGEESLFASVRELPRSDVGSIRAVRRSVRALAPDVVHAHSSLAGLFARLAVVAGRPASVVYTPHCFVFERTDIRPALRRAYRLAEWLLAINTTAIAGCCPAETDVARGWRTCRRAVHVPNSVPSTRVAASRGRRDVPLVVTTGRISPQKDPAFLLAVLRELRSHHGAVRALWVGGGAAEDVARLEAEGVEVTGWRARDEVLQLLSAGDLYLHPAAWEGFPMSVLEAHRCGLPVLVRDIAAFRALPAALRGSGPADLAASAARLLSSEVAAAANRRLWDAALSEHSADVQRTRLLEAYGVA